MHFFTLHLRRMKGNHKMHFSIYMKYTFLILKELLGRKIGLITFASISNKPSLSFYWMSYRAFSLQVQNASKEDLRPDSLFSVLNCWVFWFLPEQLFKREMVKSLI